MPWHRLGVSGPRQPARGLARWRRANPEGISQMSYRAIESGDGLAPNAIVVMVEVLRIGWQDREQAFGGNRAPLVEWRTRWNAGALLGIRRIAPLSGVWRGCGRRGRSLPGLEPLLRLGQRREREGHRRQRDRGAQRKGLRGGNGGGCGGGHGRRQCCHLRRWRCAQRARRWWCAERLMSHQAECGHDNEQNQDEGGRECLHKIPLFVHQRIMNWRRDRV